MASFCPSDMADFYVRFCPTGEGGIAEKKGN